MLECTHLYPANYVAKVTLIQCVSVHIKSHVAGEQRTHLDAQKRLFMTTTKRQAHYALQTKLVEGLIFEVKLNVRGES